MTDRSASISQYGTSYKWGTLFFPAQLRQETQLLYAFVRQADEYVDSNQRNHIQAQQQLDTMLEAFHSAYQGTPTGRRLTDEFAVLCIQKNINPDWVEAFFSAMKQDTLPTSYSTYQQVQEYMYGSAEVIGLMMCQLIGYNKSHQDEVFRTAKLLGEAMQFTNFLRDIQEDREELGRIYMPSDHLSAYNLSHTLMKQHLIHKKPVEDSWSEFMQFEIARMRKLYTEANTGITYLNTSGRFGVYLASKLYEGILDVIQKNQYDVFTKDSHTSKLQKFFLFSKAIVSYGFSKVN